MDVAQYLATLDPAKARDPILLKILTDYLLITDEVLSDDIELVQTINYIANSGKNCGSRQVVFFQSLLWSKF